MRKEKESRYDRNYWALALEGSTFIGGIAVMASGGSVALFINLMTGSKALVGLAVTIQSLLQLTGQLFIAPYTRTIRDLPKYLLRVIAMQRIIPFIISIPLFLVAPNNIAVLVFFISIVVFWFLDGLVAIPWSEFCARSLKPELRGEMMGLQITIGGAVSLATGLVLTWLLATPILNDHHRFAFIFVLAGAVFTSSVFFIPMFRDPKPIEKPEKQPMGQFYRRVPSVIKKSKPLQHILFARIPAYVAFSAATFIIVFGASTLYLSNQQTSWLVYANIIGSLIGGTLLGRVSRRFGSKAIILTCNTAVIVALGMAVSLAILPSLGYGWLFITCSLASMVQSNWIGYHTYFIDIAPEKERAVFQVVGNCIGIPFSFIGYALGAVIDRWGFITAFIAGIVAASAAVTLGLRLLSRKKLNELYENEA